MQAQLYADYEARFGDLNDLVPPQLLFTEPLEDLLCAALVRNQALTEADIKAAFPDAAFEGVRP